MRHARRGRPVLLIAPTDDTRPIPVVTTAAPTGQPAWLAVAQITTFFALAVAPSVAGLIFVGSYPWT
jgi:hypothetical protein